jgi:hypothetical protein
MLVRTCCNLCELAGTTSGRPEIVASGTRPVHWLGPFLGRGAAPSCSYCGAWYPFDNRLLWIVLGVTAALLAIFAFVKPTSL